MSRDGFSALVNVIDIEFHFEKRDDTEYSTEATAYLQGVLRVSDDISFGLWPPPPKQPEWITEVRITVTTNQSALNPLLPTDLYASCIGQLRVRAFEEVLDSSELKAEAEISIVLSLDQLDHVMSLKGTDIRVDPVFYREGAGRLTEEKKMTQGPYNGWITSYIERIYFSQAYSQGDK